MESESDIYALALLVCETFPKSVSEKFQAVLDVMLGTRPPPLIYIYIYIYIYIFLHSMHADVC